MPAHKDERFDDIAGTGGKKAYRAGKARPHAQRSRNRPEGEQSPREDFYSDEHPEVPKVRRASLYLDPHPASSHRPATGTSGSETRHTRPVSSPRKNGKQQYQEQDEYDEYDEEQAYHSGSINKVATPQSRRSRTNVPSTPPAIPQSRRSRTNVPSTPLAPSALPSTPRPPRLSKSLTHSQPYGGRRVPLKPLPRHYRRQALSPFTFLPQLIQRQNLATLAGFAVGLILVFVLISTLLHNLFPQTPGIMFIPTTDTTTNGTNTNGSTSTDPHALVITPINSDHPAPPVYAQSAYLLDANTGATLYAQNPFAHLPIMSTTKLMTALLAVEHGNLDQSITINDQIANDINQLPPDSANINLKKGETYTLRQMMYGLLLASGNDAAVAIADTIGGTFSNFITMMNQRAADLGLHDTHFENPDGLQQANHYSSAHDLAIIGLHSLSNPLVHQISGTLNYHIDQSPQHAAHDFFNGNEFIWWYPGVDAGKPGYDAATNFVQVISCVRNGHHLIGVVIHTIDWWTDMRDLMNWGFNTYTWVSPHDSNTPSHPVPYAGLWGNFDRDKKENTIPIANQGRYYIATGYSITGDIENYFDKNGGLASFGFPTSPPKPVGIDMLNQRFEHATIQCNTQNKQCQKGT